MTALALSSAAVLCLLGMALWRRHQRLAAQASHRAVLWANRPMTDFERRFYGMVWSMQRQAVAIGRALLPATRELGTTLRRASESVRQMQAAAHASEEAP